MTMTSHNNWSSSTAGSPPQIGSSSRVFNTGVDQKIRETTETRQIAEHNKVMLAMYIHDPDVGSEAFQAPSLTHDIRHGNNAGMSSMGQQEWKLFEEYKEKEGHQRAAAAIRDFDTNFNKKGHGHRGVKGTRTKRSGSVGLGSSQPAAKKTSSTMKK